MTVGYLAYEKQGKTLFLSKIYLLDSHRGKESEKRQSAFLKEKAHTWNAVRLL